MNVYPNAPGHRNVDTSIAAAMELAPKLGRLQRRAEAAIRDAGPRGLSAPDAQEMADPYAVQTLIGQAEVGTYVAPRKGLIN